MSDSIVEYLRKCHLTLDTNLPVFSYPLHVYFTGRHIDTFALGKRCVDLVTFALSRIIV